jgi:hypothetical protein
MSTLSTLVRKDLRMMRNRWLTGVGVMLVIGMALAVSSYTGTFNPSVATALAIMMVMGSFFVLPAGLYRGLNTEMKRTPSLWLQTPESGWGMLTSKLVTSFVGGLLFIVVADLLAFIMLRIDLSRAMATMDSIQREYAVVIQNEMPRVGLYATVTLLFLGMYTALWVSTVYLCVKAVKKHLHKFSWLVGLVLIVIATWGLGAFEHTALYESLFGWGRFHAMSLFPSHVQSVITNHNDFLITSGHIVFDLIVMLVLFYVSGRLIDRHVEV